MTLKIKAWENSREKIIPIDDIIASGIKFRYEQFEPADVSNNRFTLQYEPFANSEHLVYNGLTLHYGVNYDYTIDGQDIVFAADALFGDGVLEIRYCSL